ncbi:hypothetical protein KM043_004550 [Ampulex compressa]|nr:hypothetical protein KM043_004550 [Ampulex compressa]
MRRSDHPSRRFQERGVFREVEAYVGPASRIESDTPPPKNRRAQIACNKDLIEAINGGRGECRTGADGSDRKVVQEKGCWRVCGDLKDCHRRVDACARLYVYTRCLEAASSLSARSSPKTQEQ